MSLPSAWWCQLQSFYGINGTYVTEPHLPRTALVGKWVIISGGNNGIGREAALFFAKKGANLVLACRKPPAWETHPDEAVKECKATAKSNEHTASQIEWWSIDMADLKSVESFAQRWKETGRALDILCNNAGVGTPPSDATTFRTTDGMEFIHQVNFMSHVLLTIHLLPSLAKATKPRIVCTTSCMQFLGHFDLDNFNWEDETTAKGSPYGNNKLYFQMWLTELQQRMSQDARYNHIVINGVHPGFVKSGIWNSNRPGKVPPKKTWLGMLMYASLGYMSITSQQGSLAITHAAVTDEAGRCGGRYFNRIWERPSMPQCQDGQARLQLWNRIERDLQLKERGLSNLFVAS